MKTKLIALLMLLTLILASCTPSGETSDTVSDDVSASAPTKTATVTNDELADKIKGAWAGQMAGVVLGAKQEFWYQGTTMPDDQVEDFSTLNINDAFTQDDLYVEITYIEQMMKTGYDSSLKLMADAFKNSKYPLDHANKIGRENLQKGINAPDSGSYKYNLHCDDIDWQINADFVGQMYPGNPNAAAARAFELGHITNYGDGVYGGVFVSAMNAAAYTAESIDEIIKAGYDAIPADTRFKAVLDDVINAHKDGKTWKETWQIVEDKWGSDDRCPWYCYGPQNIDAKLNSAYILIGLLYGEGDFINSMVISMQCGQDSDCNPSSVGGILGAYYGFSSLPEKCVKGLDLTTTKFTTTQFTLSQTIDACIKLMGDSIKTYATATDGGYDIPVFPVNSVPFEQWPDMPSVEFSATVGADSVVTIMLNAVDNSGIKSIKFDMGDGKVFFDSISAYKYEKAGTYTIKLVVTNNNGASVEHTATVTTTADFEQADDENKGKYRNLASLGYPMCSVTAPKGTGDKSLEQFRDGKKPNVGDYNPGAQFDTFAYSALVHDEYIGYIFTSPFELNKVVFTEGMNFDNGGWFANGTLKLQLLIADGDVAVWTDVETEVDPAYPNGNTQAAFGSSFETYTFNFEKTVCMGVRLIGEAGGSAHFISVAELEAYGVEA